MIQRKVHIFIYLCMVKHILLAFRCRVVVLSFKILKQRANLIAITFEWKVLVFGLRKQPDFLVF